MMDKRQSEQSAQWCGGVSQRNDHSATVEAVFACESDAMHTGHVSASETDAETRLEVVATREIRYSTVHPSGYLLDPANPALRDAAAGKPILAVVDARVDKLYGTDLRTYFKSGPDLRGYFVVDGSEAAKTWNQAQRICFEAVKVELPRHGIIMAVGGGVTLDIAGFAASVFRRGVNFVRVPTSLIGLIDVGVGIKHGINFSGKKSIVGTFYPPMLNINDLTFLSTLPEKHIACGLAEIIKMAMVRDAGLFSLLESNAGQLLLARFQNSAVAREVVIRAEHLMMQELQPNLFELQLRRLPDFGHSFSPAIEAATRWSINHGEAVALDMLISTGIAVCKGLCSPNVLDRLRRLLLSAKLPITHDVCTPTLMLKALKSVKAHRAGNLNLVVPLGLGQAGFVQDVGIREIEYALTQTAGGSETYASVVGRPGWYPSAVRSVA